MPKITFKDDKAIIENPCPGLDAIEWRRKSFDALLGPFGGGWTTKFSLLIGTSKWLVEFWRWEIHFYLSTNDDE